MSLSRKADVKSHLSKRGREGSRPFEPATLLDATGTSTPEANEAATSFADDFIGEHSPPSADVAPLAKSAKK